MRIIAILLILIVIAAGCVESTTTSTTVPTTTTSTIATTTVTTAETTITTTTTEETTTVMGNVEKGIDLIVSGGGKITIKNLGRIKEILTSEVKLFINDQEVNPKWIFTIIYPTGSTDSRLKCNNGDMIRVAGPVNEDSDICIG